MSKNKNKKQKKVESEDEEDEEMYMQLTEIKNDESPKKKKDKKRKSSPKKKKSSKSQDDDNYDEDELEEIDIYEGRRETISNYQDLTEVSGLIIKQQFSLCETLTGCQTENVYEIFPAKSEDQEINEQSVPILKSFEESNCFVRNILTGRCRPFEMTISTHISNGQSHFHEQVVLVLKRQYQCTFFCWKRPTIEVYQVKKGVHELVGRVMNPFNFCDLNIHITDRFDKQLFSVNASCCQGGFICQNFGCKPCQRMEFNVHDHDGNEFTKIYKTQHGCCVNCVSDASRYYLNFPQGTENSEKLLLLSATILIDYIYFEGGSKICLNL